MKILRVKSQKWFKVALAVVIAMSLAVPIGKYAKSANAEAVFENEPTFNEQVYRSDIKLVKVNGDTMERLSNIPFLITSKTTGEAHVVVSDDNGMINTSADWNKHSKNTNANDAAVSSSDEAGLSSYKIDESKLDNTAGVWFEQDVEGNKIAVDDTLGAISFDTYNVKELEIDKTRYLKHVDVDIVVNRDGIVYDMGTMDDNPIIPEIDTVASDKADNDKEVSVAEDSIVLDKVSYKNLLLGQEYQINGSLHKVNEDGTDAGEIEGTLMSATFTPDKNEGEISVELSVNTTDLNGAKIVAYEEVVDLSDQKVVAEHKDITDADQSVNVKKAEENLPETGDQNLNFALGLLALSFVSCASVYVAKKQRNK